MVGLGGWLRRFRLYFTHYADEQVMRKNITNNIWDGIWYSVMVGLTSSFMGVYALALGATDVMLGWLSALPALVALLSQIPAAMITERQQLRLQVSLPFGLVFRSGYLVFAFIPLLPLQPVQKTWLFIFLVSVLNFPATVSGVAWSAMMGDIFPSNLRGRVFGDRNMLLGIVQMICTLLAGPILDTLPYPYNFMLLFFLSFTSLMLSSWYQSKIVEFPALSRQRQSSSVWNWFGIRVACQDQLFLNFVVAFFAFNFGLNFASAMWTIYYVKVLGLSKTYIGNLSVISQLVTVCFCRWWGRLADKRGHHWVLGLSMLGLVPGPFLHNFVHTPWLLIPLSILSGFAGAGYNLILFNTLLDMAPDEGVRPSYIAVFNTVMGLTGFLAPLVGISVYQRQGMSVVFSLSSLLRLLGLVYLVWQVGIKREKQQEAV